MVYFLSILVKSSFNRIRLSRIVKDTQDFRYIEDDDQWNDRNIMYSFWVFSYNVERSQIDV